MTLPHQRVQSVSALVGEIPEGDSAAAERAAEELAKMIQQENDPLVRRQIVKSASRLQGRLAEKIVLAALRDDAPMVRVEACAALEQNPTIEATAVLAQTLRGDQDLDVKLAATQALGVRTTGESVAALGSAIHDTDPALQLAGAEALGRASGEELGRDIGAWRQWLASRQGGSTNVAASQSIQPESMTQ